ncbi:AI-2E family transporter [Anaerovorax odorimutans]|uniref:AI-2E family transporter n=1 Tax=Anaerovorax odorimutans TaxID=109327 RepID=A0ABT1RPX7_9FIRM|nr:AI-2E family transporter [Anaerovorax odorimutans]MCQ4637247.1 AI-2E family transporter [Anaerovorax odorimutans]
MKFQFEEKQKKWGLTAFFVIVAAILVFFAIYRFDVFSELISIGMAILTPFIYGLVFAYLLCPIYNFTTRNMYSALYRRARRPKWALSLSKGVATFISILVFFIVITGFCWMIIPGLINSIMHVVDILPDSMNRFIHWIDTKTTNYPEMQATLENWVNRFTDNVVKYVEEKMLPSYMEIATSISTGVFGVITILKNFFVGIIICVYFLNSKDLFAAQSKKLILATFSEKRAGEILRGAAYTNKTFGGFINGKIIDSLIVGLICFIVMSILNWEYPLLISCIIGITNIIPFFGPFIGAIPSALLILMVNPMQCIYFLIFILILQQVDGNIIGPKILGDSTGLSSFWVMFAILVGGGLFGFVGMIVGIPIFAVFYAYFSRNINRRLDKRGFSTDIRDYTIDKYRVKEKKKKKKKKKKEGPGSGIFKG